MGALKLATKPWSEINQDPRLTQAVELEKEIKVLQEKANKLRNELESENGYEILDNLLNVHTYLKETLSVRYNYLLDESIDSLGEVIDSLSYYYADQGLDTREYRSFQ